LVLKGTDCVHDKDKLRAERGSKAIAALNGKWKLKILVAMQDGCARLSELERLIPDATKKMLIDSLHSLEADGVVLRRELESWPVRRVEYEIVAVMREATRTAVDSLADWGQLLG
jgi:DNA-binding HxlR family transcriptional regulator